MNPARQPVRPYKRRTRVQLFWEIFWAVWLAMLLVGDPIANWIYGEKASDTHFLVTHISIGLRPPVIAWVTWHFLVAHKNA